MRWLVGVGVLAAVCGCQCGPQAGRLGSDRLGHVVRLDAGVDAGRAAVDAGGPDAGAPDAGLPAACLDAGFTCGRTGEAFCGVCPLGDVCGDGGSGGVCLALPRGPGCTRDGTCSAVPQMPWTTLEDVWGSAPDDVWAVGAHGAIWHFDGGAWEPVPSGVSAALEAVTGTSATDAWAVGAHGAIVHWDGVRWSEVPSPTTAHLTDVHAVSATDAWAIGALQTLIRWDGAAWHVFHMGGAFGEYSALAGRAADDLWVVDYFGSARHFDGGTWSAPRQAPSGQLTGAWVDDAGVLWTTGMVASRFTVHAYDGTAWSTPVDRMHGPALAIAGFGDSLCAVGGNPHVQCKDATGWSPRAALSTPATVESFHGVWLEAPGTGWAVGTSGGLVRLAPSGWHHAAIPSRALWWDLHGTAPSNLWAVGYGAVLHDDGTGWRPTPPPGSGFTVFHSVRALPSGETWLFSAGASAWQHAGTSYAAVPLPASALGRYGAWAGDEELWTAAGPVLERRDARGWAVVDAGAGTIHQDVSGTSRTDVWSVGGSGVHHFDGTQWTSTTLDAGQLFAVAAWSPTAAFATGLDGVVFRWDGQAWAPLPPVPFPQPAYHQLLALVPRGPNDVWALGHALAHWDGAHWESFDLGTPMLITGGVWADGGLWMAGQDGYVLHREAR